MAEQVAIPNMKKWLPAFLSTDEETIDHHTRHSAHKTSSQGQIASTSQASTSGSKILTPDKKKRRRGRQRCLKYAPRDVSSSSEDLCSHKNDEAEKEKPSSSKYPNGMTMALLTTDKPWIKSGTNAEEKVKKVRDSPVRKGNARQGH